MEELEGEGDPADLDATQDPSLLEREGSNSKGPSFCRSPSPQPSSPRSPGLTLPDFDRSGRTDLIPDPAFSVPERKSDVSQRRLQMRLESCSRLGVESSSGTTSSKYKQYVELGDIGGCTTEFFNFASDESEPESPIYGQASGFPGNVEGDAGVEKAHVVKQELPEGYVRRVVAIEAQRQAEKAERKRQKALIEEAREQQMRRFEDRLMDTMDMTKALFEAFQRIGGALAQQIPLPIQYALPETHGASSSQLQLEAPAPQNQGQATPAASLPAVLDGVLTSAASPPPSPPSAPLVPSTSSPQFNVVLPAEPSPVRAEENVAGADS